MDRVARFETFARLGFLARGVVYLLLGWLALTTAGGEGTTSVLQRIAEMPAGSILLGAMAVGLAGYGAFRIVTALLDLEGAGRDAKGAAMRAGYAASGLAHFVLAWIAIKMAIGWGGAAGGGQGEGDAARAVMAWPGGGTVVLLVGVGFLAAGLEQFVKAWTSKFMRHLDSRAPKQVEWLGRAGYAARGVVFTIIGWQIVRAARGQGNGALGFDPALAAMQETGWAFTLVAIGLFLFGAFSLTLARYHRICDDDVIARLKAAVA